MMGTHAHTHTHTHTRWAAIQHFFDVYVYLFFLIALSVGLNFFFKFYILEDCIDPRCVWAPCQ